MLRQTTVFLHSEDMAKLKALAESRRITTAPLIRLAILEYLRRAAIEDVPEPARRSAKQAAK